MTAPQLPSGVLSDTQHEALTLAANGLTAEQIARRLHSTGNAIHLRLNAAAHQLGASSRAHAVALALVRGLIDPADIHQPVEGCSGDTARGGPQTGPRAPHASVATLSRIAAARALHRPLQRGGGAYCAHCSGWDGRRALGVLTDYPCPTLRALGYPAQQNPGPTETR